ncbi:ABC transporter ATP-binding protein [Arthrobacter sp. UM1]|uniref:ABC transporter ATP-binding protein n=1 Tax=Arthrobacter sp. UM1 TaxID=2766776 RepID=UPI001CF6535C|nr:ABC transporter ATP-binding protein [Arthrobacter sp. UM1]MCB4209212.1 ABC transporter ATP-binding protein [Arthrobacter sp. UM1]
MRLEFQDVRVARGGRPILNGVSLAAEPGRFLGLIGANGSGKSTLLKAAYRAMAPDSGEVLVDGQPVSRLSQRELALRIGVMSQEFGADFPLSAREVIALGRVPHQRGFGAESEADAEAVQEAARATGAHPLLGRAFGGLSGGEKQRVLLAKALAQATPVLLLDEPTNHADLGFQRDLLHLVRSRGATVVAALHDLNLALEYCDDAALLTGGRITAAGPAEDVLTAEAVDAVFDVHTLRLPDPRGGHVFAFRRAEDSRGPDPADDAAADTGPSGSAGSASSHSTASPPSPHS